VRILAALHHYQKSVQRLIFHPTIFFARMPLEGRALPALVFAITVRWIASAVSLLWKQPILSLLRSGWMEGSGILSDFTTNLSPIDHPGRHAESIVTPELWERIHSLVLPWFWGVSSVLLDPFFSLASILFTTALIFVGARILVQSEKPVRFSSTLKIVSFANAAMIWSIIPLIGVLVAPLAVIITTCIAFQEIYQTSWLRSFVIAVFPKIIFFVSALTGLVVLLWLAFKTFTALLGFP
jgi:hypothetical protein